jgi:hypothetical protein
MFAAGPLNNYFLDLFGATARVSKTPLVGWNNARTMEFFADFMPLAFDSPSTTNMATIGTTHAGGWFECDTPAAATTTVAPIRFASARNGVYKYSGDGEVELGKRTILYGKDDGVNVTAYQGVTNLASATAQADWTAAQAAIAIDIPTTFDIAYDSVQVAFTSMRLYEAWVKINGIVVIHYRPKPYMASASELDDLSGYGNEGTIAGVKDTDWRIAETYSATAPSLVVEV